MGNTAAIFTLYYYMYRVRNLTHAVTTLLHDIYFTVFCFNVFWAEMTVFQITMSETLELQKAFSVSDNTY